MCARFSPCFIYKDTLIAFHIAGNLIYIVFHYDGQRGSYDCFLSEGLCFVNFPESLIKANSPNTGCMLIVDSFMYVTKFRTDNLSFELIFLQYSVFNFNVTCVTLIIKIKKRNKCNFCVMFKIELCNKHCGQQRREMNLNDKTALQNKNR